MTDADELTLASLLVSRLMHDLAASAGAVSNGVEMVKEEGADAGAIELLEFSAGETVRRLEFFRLAFGAAGGLGVRQPLDEARAKTRAFFEGRRVRVEWAAGTAADAPQPVVKTILNLVLLAAEALPKGGTVTVAVEDGRIGVTAAGSAAALTDEKKSALAGVPSALNARLVQPYYAGALARGLQSKVAFEESPDRLVLSVALVS